MGLFISTHLKAILLFFYCFCLIFCASIDTITPTQFIKFPETIISSGNIYKLGFFSPPGSTNRYVGIWYNEISVSTVVWIANRDTPLKNSSGIVNISKEGNLQILNEESNDILWSTNSSNTLTNATAQLFDNGSLVLKEVNSPRVIWESFQHPSDSMLPEMKLGSNIRTGEKQILTSWKSPTDPSSGTFSAGMDPLNIPEIFIWNGSRPYWRSGPWNGQGFTGVETTTRVYTLYLEGFNLIDDKNGYFYITYSANESSVSYKMLSSQGKIEQKHWDDEKKDWEITWFSPETECDVYGKCGAFGRCNSKDSPICSCLRGFEPKNVEEWSRRNWTSGCTWKKQLQCEIGKEDGFLKLGKMNVPDFAELSSSLEEECKTKCLQNCSCLAYAFDAGIGCMSWRESLIDIQQFRSGGLDFYIRLPRSQLKEETDVRVIITITVIIGTIVIAIFTGVSWFWKAKRKAKNKQSKELLLSNRGEASPTFSDGNMLGDNVSRAKLQELPLFNFEILAAATNNFHLANKLGQGGFGPVYKGKLLNGQEIAVKRLSRASGQGQEEFMNEVVVIAKLQHRNLVRLLGCCVEGEEKMLIYEYMPNKSLDAFLFDPLKKQLLHWRKRFYIIEAIGRGLLYLHRDSRLRIIHRDLKASNILLDEELNPKISDFGLARIFGSDQDQANTKRVVGTYGYMSPEYAMEGRFSEKSDVFSFGVLLLEIISGRRNTSFYNDEQSLSLLGFAWKLWNEENLVPLIDPIIFDSSFQTEMVRCIHVGLLCVQEFAKDRPTVTNVLSMLSSEIANLPTPKQPAFTEQRIGSDTESSQQSQKRFSINNVTITNIKGR